MISYTNLSALTSLSLLTTVSLPSMWYVSSTSEPLIHQVTEGNGRPESMRPHISSYQRALVFFLVRGSIIREKYVVFVYLPQHRIWASLDPPRHRLQRWPWRCRCVGHRFGCAESWEELKENIILLRRNSGHLERVEINQTIKMNGYWKKVMIYRTVLTANICLNTYMLWQWYGKYNGTLGAYTVRMSRVSYSRQSIFGVGQGHFK